MTDSAAPTPDAPDAPDAPTATRDAQPPPAWLRALTAAGRRWPSLLALAWAVYSLSDVGDGLEYVILFVLPAAGYLFLAVADRPRISWAVVIALLATVVILRALDIDPWPPLALVVIALTALGLVNGRLRSPRIYALQPAGALAFLASGLLALSVPPTAGGYLVAAGLLGHALWDGFHYRANKIVARSYAEWCGVLDLVLGLGLLVVLLTR
ncbi:hypothetical protein [Nonomuraea gerenzanensis]|uniref:Uncharacterized protein n=1 Tax=Nonomuraea gerenzanensis TaxID=93944 RepID=A0A1M4E4V6_9ACTN|nr:hypothetical protein [Nonomuraea gerenzanensis]UBU16076.1 hypothetical protein LCN96_14015 [Nonomuraea gerenzanensis]SBO93879.1 hypothetical protein BN4615_P3395 [Nonomuraea gerenzanensis]